ncbi:hypothetical protein EVAR_95762_1 [Eumeta japonica]|uniref:Uncharacterized protein n=1 Tax=Eumeta variegata TaxID=151549 RepID=A0A4C1ULX6_EUMVA|nr:hypothetical protein EVAR_95762_1 [Eumeta japonica]
MEHSVSAAPKRPTEWEVPPSFTLTLMPVASRRASRPLGSGPRRGFLTNRIEFTARVVALFAHSLLVTIRRDQSDRASRDRRMVACAETLVLANASHSLAPNMTRTVNESGLSIRCAIEMTDKLKAIFCDLSDLSKNKTTVILPTVSP